MFVETLALWETRQSCGKRPDDPPVVSHQLLAGEEFRRVRKKLRILRAKKPSRWKTSSFSGWILLLFLRGSNLVTVTRLGLAAPSRRKRSTWNNSDQKIESGLQPSASPARMFHVEHPAARVNFAKPTCLKSLESNHSSTVQRPAPDEPPDSPLFARTGAIDHYASPSPQGSSGACRFHGAPRLRVNVELRRHNAPADRKPAAQANRPYHAGFALSFRDKPGIHRPGVCWALL